ncbi:hypothetical protein [Sphingomonas crusticola]|uniref:hypothetical protein n=1 Tax=Sphingomonas crusticola TaxID=1697973 RepID=UPI000E246045|nr:hypothetical protein [Sphingomonas crusticola]
MSRTHFLGVNLNKHPLLAGLLWAALFVPTLLVLNWLRGEPTPLHDIPKLVALAIPAGLLWGLVTRAFTKARGSHAR